ncbi:MFS transporter [Ghiorsea bivora]|uniref:MFS transporter n=1 Tax=Ghiorsea bivora TaxID=1485545 RepID=UPI00056EB986|nr:MFS transporter [Ghiorsea bivora]
MRKSKQSGMNAQERKSVSALSSIFALRMMGLFLILPVFSTYAHGLDGALEHPELVGIALGAYGLTQALFQIPFGMMSDKFGRKPVIAVGMVIFAMGSFMAGMSDDIVGVLIGRVIQGSGAVAAAVIALTADLTREEHRTKAMASIGITIGMSFAVSMAIAPLLNEWIGVNGIFMFTGGLSLLSILVLYVVVPDPENTGHHSDSEVTSSMFKEVLRHGALLRLDVGVLILHMSLTALFVVLPLVLVSDNLLPSAEQWKLYLPVMLVAFMLMVPFIIIAEAKRKMKQVFLSAIAMLIIASLMFAWAHDSLWWVAAALLVFFTGFNTLEASMPSLVSKYAPAGAKGTAVGVFNTSQFFGAFIGGVLGGFLYDPIAQNFATVFYVVAAMLTVWWLIALTMAQPPYVATITLRVDAKDEQHAQRITEQLLALDGVADVRVIIDEGAAYCKIDKKVIDEDELVTKAAAFI